jgi:transposase
MPSWVIAQLESWKHLLELAERELRQIEGQLQKAVAPRKLFFGEGELTHELLARELIDPQRFRNARQEGNYFGLCPSESRSAERRRLGSITKHGNPRLRRLMVELAWRVSRLQPSYRGVLHWGALLGKRKGCTAAVQESDRGAGPASRRRSLAHCYRAGAGSPTRAALKRDPSDQTDKEALPRRKSFL